MPLGWQTVAIAEVGRAWSSGTEGGEAMSAPRNGPIHPDSGETVSLGGLGVVFKLSGADTGGAFSIVEHPLRPGALAAPPHTHSREDEISLVLDGEIGVLVGDAVFTATKGAYVVKPRGVPHTFWNAGADPARVQEIITPAGFEAYFRDVAAVLAASREPDIPRLIAIATRYGVTMHMERVPAVMQEHGVRL
jgi:quercetin dioxygenase-like cupin family protein